MRLHIAVYAFDGVTMFHLSIPQAVFGSVARLGLADWEVGLFTTRPAPGRESPGSGIDSPASIRTAEGYLLGGLSGPGLAETADVVVVPAWFADGRQAGAELCSLLESAHRRGTAVVGLCLGPRPGCSKGAGPRPTGGPSSPWRTSTRRSTWTTQCCTSTTATS